MVKRPNRTPEQEENRKELENHLRKLRQYWNAWKELAKIMLEERKTYDWYQESEAKYIKEKEKAMEEKLKSKEKEKEKANQFIQKKIKLYDFDDSSSGLLWTVIEGQNDWILNMDTAKKLIDAWYLRVLSHHLRKFEKLDKEIAEIILNSKYWYNVVDNLEMFDWIDYNQLALELIKEKRNENLSKNLGKFKGLTKETAKAWLDSGYYTENILHHLDSFVWLDKEVLLKLERNRSRLYMSNDEKSRAIKLFSWLDKEVAMMILKSTYYIPASCIVDNIDQFEWLDIEVAEKLVKVWYWDFVAKHPEKFWLKKER